MSYRSQFVEQLAKNWAAGGWDAHDAIARLVSMLEIGGRFDARDRYAIACILVFVEELKMGAHIKNGQFQSDKYPECPPGKVPLSVKDTTAQDLLWTYAQRRRVLDAEFSDDLETSLRAAGYVPRSITCIACEPARVGQTGPLTYSAPESLGVGPLVCCKCGKACIAYWINE